MNLKPVYMTTIDLQNEFSRNFETIHNEELNLKELNSVIRAYLTYCSDNEPISTYQFTMAYLD